MPLIIAKINFPFKRGQFKNYTEFSNDVPMFHFFAGASSLVSSRGDILTDMQLYKVLVMCHQSVLTTCRGLPVHCL